MDPVHGRPRPHGRAGRACFTVEGLYPEETWAVAALRGNDLVTLVVVAPALAVALVASRRHPTSASVLVWLGPLFYGVYNFAYDAFGAAFSDVFLLHVAAFSLSTIGLLMLGSSIDAVEASKEVVGGTRARVVAAFTTVVGLALFGAWGTMSVRFAVTGQLPEDVMPPAAVHLVYALDMGVLAPRSSSPECSSGGGPWGGVLGYAINASGAAYLAVLEAVGGFQADAGIAGEDVAVARRDRCGPRVPRRHARPARAPAPAPGGRRKRQPCRTRCVSRARSHGTTASSVIAPVTPKASG